MLMKDLKAKSNEELVKLIDDLKAELFMLRFKNSTGQLEQPHKIDLIKKDIARVFTVINSNESTVAAPAAKKETVKEAK